MSRSTGGMTRSTQISAPSIAQPLGTIKGARRIVIWLKAAVKELWRPSTVRAKGRVAPLRQTRSSCLPSLGFELRPHQSHE